MNHASGIRTPKDELLTTEAYNRVNEALVNAIQSTSFPQEVRDSILVDAADHLAPNIMMPELVRPGGTNLTFPMMVATPVPRTTGEMKAALDKAQEQILSNLEGQLYEDNGLKPSEEAAAGTAIKKAFVAAQNALSPSVSRSR